MVVYQDASIRNVRVYFNDFVSNVNTEREKKIGKRGGGGVGGDISHSFNLLSFMSTMKLKF